jgi:hypothetical protein
MAMSDLQKGLPSHVDGRGRIIKSDVLVYRLHPKISRLARRRKNADDQILWRLAARGCPPPSDGRPSFSERISRKYDCKKYIIAVVVVAVVVHYTLTSSIMELSDPMDLEDLDRDRRADTKRLHNVTADLVRGKKSRIDMQSAGLNIGPDEDIGVAIAAVKAVDRVMPLLREEHTAMGLLSPELQLVRSAMASPSARPLLDEFSTRERLPTARERKNASPGGTLTMIQARGGGGKGVASVAPKSRRGGGIGVVTGATLNTLAGTGGQDGMLYGEAIPVAVALDILRDNLRRDPHLPPPPPPLLSSISSKDHAQIYLKEFIGDDRDEDLENAVTEADADAIRYKSLQGIEATYAKVTLSIEKRRHLKESVVSNVPLTAKLPLVPRLYMEKYRMPLPSTATRHCCNGQACRFNYMPENGGYIGREFLLPGEAELTDADPLRPCIDCILWQLGSAINSNLEQKQVLTGALNTFTVAVGVNEYSADCMLPYQINGEQTGIIGPVPRYEVGYRIYKQIPNNKRAVYGLGDEQRTKKLHYLAETNMDFHKASAESTVA